MKQCNVLIADDETIIRQGMEQYIPWGEEFQLVGSAKNGLEALEMLQSQPVDILITDIKMPVMSGMELLEELHRKNLEVLVVVVSAYDDFAFAKQAIKSRMVYDYILKPFDFEEFVLLLREMASYLNLQTAHRPQTVPMPENTPGEAPPYSALIRACLDLMEAQFSQADLTLGSLANQLSVSSNYLSVSFKKETGTGFVKHLHQRRVAMAKELLMDVRLKAYEIANAVGYEDARYFSRIFREYTGLTPSEYRESFYLSDEREVLP